MLTEGALLHHILAIVICVNTSLDVFVDVLIDCSGLLSSMHIGIFMDFPVSILIILRGRALNSFRYEHAYRYGRQEKGGKDD